MSIQIPGELTLTKLKIWGKPILLSIIDQGIFSGINFLVNILLVRWMAPEIFGIYSVTFSIFLLTSSIQNAIALEPISVFGLSRHSEKLNDYVSVLFTFQFIILFVIGLLFFLSSLLTSHTATRESLLGLSMGVPFILCFWFFRRVFYLKGQISHSIITSLVYAGIYIIGIIGLKTLDLLNPMIAFLSSALSGLLASITAIVILRLNPFRGFIQIFNSDISTIINETWNYSRWFLLAVVANWVASLSVIPLLSFFSGPHDAAAYRSIEILFLPILQIMTAFQLFYLPRMARDFSQKNKKYLHHQTIIVLRYCVMASLVYILVIQLWGTEVVNILFDREFYGSHVWMIPFFSITIVISVITQVFSINLRVLNRPSAVFWAKGWPAIFILGLGLVLIEKYGLPGAIIASIGSVFIEMIISVYFYIKKISE